MWALRWFFTLIVDTCKIEFILNLPLMTSLPTVILLLLGLIKIRVGLIVEHLHIVLYLEMLVVYLQLFLKWFLVYGSFAMVVQFLLSFWNLFFDLRAASFANILRLMVRILIFHHFVRCLMLLLIVLFTFIVLLFL